MIWKEVYLALGGNVGDSIALIRSALSQIAALDHIIHFKASPLYRTPPVSDLAQADFVNAVCSFKTTLEATALFALLQEIEIRHGKVPKPKNFPRSLDIDLLFYGLETSFSKELEIPHPRWRERLFVLIPLADLTQEIHISDANKGVQKVSIPSLIQSFPSSDIQQIQLAIPLEKSILAKIESADPLDCDKFIAQALDEEQYEGDASLLQRELISQWELLKFS